MRRLAVLLLVVAAAGGCKKKKSGTAVPAAKDAGPAAAAVDAAPPLKSANMSKAPPAPVADADDCKLTGEYAAPLLRVVALDRKVPNDKIDGVEKAATAAFIESCNQDHWPAGFLDCIGKSKAELFTWQRCMPRFPDAMRVAWEVRFDDIVAKAGGTTTAGSEVAPPGGGVAFETLCADFVAEMARFDDCAGAGMYVPDLENVFVGARTVAVGGVIPPDKQAGLKQECDAKTVVVRELEATTCAMK